MLTCFFAHRRLGAYLDGALDEPVARSTASHLAVCTRCQREIESLRSLRAALQRLRPAPEPDWTGFWPGVVRRIEEARLLGSSPVRRRGWRQPRWALGGAALAAVAVSVVAWQLSTSPIAPSDFPPVMIRSADTDDPRGSVMVYSTREQDVTVVWVLGLD